MTDCGERALSRGIDFDSDEAERLLLHLYTGLRSCLPRRTGGAATILARFGLYEVRLTEFPAVPAAVARALSRRRARAGGQLRLLRY
jgi:hypothetical protein